MLQSLDRDNIYNLINSMEYPAIRALCLTNQNTNNICTKDPEIRALIAKKLDSYIDLILNSMIEAKGLVNDNGMVFSINRAPFSRGTPFTMKRIKLLSLIPRHEFELIDNYDPTFFSKNPYHYIITDKTGPRYELRETLTYYINDSKGSDSISLNINEIRKKLASLLKDGIIG